VVRGFPVRFLRRLKIWREIRRLEARVRDQPTPTTYVDLGQVYVNLGMMDHTLRVAKEGAELFPQSQEIRKLHRFVQRSMLKARIVELRRGVNKSPSPGQYRELAARYLELGDHGAVQETCEESVRRFPDDVESHVMLARSTLASFYRDLKADDGRRAVSCLEHVIALDDQDHRVHKMLSELLYRIGAVDRARHHLDRLRELSPGDLDVEVLYRRLKDHGPPSEQRLDELFREIEGRDALPHGPVISESRQRASADREQAIRSIRKSLDLIARAPGVSKAAYIRGSKALIKGEIKDGKDPFLRMARVIAKAAQRTCRRMDLGNFSKGVVDGGFGHVCVCSFGDVVAAALCTPDSGVDRVLGDLQDLVAQSLYRSEVRAR